MQPLSDTENEQETLSFLPEAPVVHVRVPKRKQKKNCCSCRPWVIQSILFLVTFTSVITIKFYFATTSTKILKTTKWKDLNLKDIKHWCLQTNVTTCRCANPLQPTHRHGHKTWTEAHLKNVKLSRNSASKSANLPLRELDVVFLGDSIIEGWMGTSFAQKVEKKQDNVKVFENLFDMDSGQRAEFDGLALGIAGDKSQNLLWRLKNGEMPKKLKSKVYWILIGTNDFLKGGQSIEQCSEEVVLMGVIRVVKEMMILRPSSTIVVNGLLPRSDIGRETDGRLYKENEKTVMDAIDVVNMKLQEFCALHDDLEYFDASALFTAMDSKLGEGNFSKYIPEELMKDRLHPTASGYEKWGNQIVEKLRMVLNGKLILE